MCNVSFSVKELTAHKLLVHFKLWHGEKGVVCMLLLVLKTKNNTKKSVLKSSLILRCVIFVDCHCTFQSRMLRSCVFVQ